MKSLRFLPLALLLFSDCSENNSFTEVLQSPPAVRSTFVINGKSKAIIGWEMQTADPVTKFSVYKDTVAEFSFSTAKKIATVASMPVGGLVDSPLVNGKDYYYTVFAENIGSNGLTARGASSNTARARPFDYSSLPLSSIKYSDHIQPIFTSGCAVHGCHVGADDEGGGSLGKSLSTKHGGVFSLKSWGDVMKGDGSISVVIPYKSTKSDLVKHLNRDSTIAPSSEPPMPKAIPFPKDQLDVIMRWIDDGAKGNVGEIAYSAMPTRGRAYITNQGEDLVAVLDMDENIVTRYVTAGVPNTQVQPPQSPHGVVVDLQNQYYYANLIGGSKLLKFRVSDNAKIGELTTGINSPAQVVLNATGDTAYVSNFQDQSKAISVVNTKTMTFIGQVNDPAMLKPHGVAMAPDFSYILTANQFSDNATLIRTADNSVAATIPLSGSVPPLPINYSRQFEPYQLSITPDGKYAFVTCRKSDEVRVISIDSLKVVDSIKVGTTPLICDVTPDGQFVYVANQKSNSVSVINTSTRKVATTIQNAGVQPHGVGISKDGKYAYVSCENLTGVIEPPHHATSGGKQVGIVTVIDVAANTIVRQLEVGNFAAGVAVTH